MQGKKEYQEKLFAHFQLSERIPKNNFYRRLKEVLELRFLYGLTEGYYGNSGQKSIDPVVFFKLCLVGYLENIISDRRLMAHCSLRLDILYFIGYDIDEELPWHSTISRTRQLFPESVFEEVFTKVLSMCVEKGMVSGHTQAIDSAPVKANASMDTLELKVPERELDEHLRKVRVLSAMDKKGEPHRKSKNDSSDKGQRSVTASKNELAAIKGRNKKWAKDQDQRPGAKNKGAKYTSNKTHYSPTDPDARISVKPGKARKLNYLSQLSVDTANHVITDIRAYHADGKDNQQLPDIVQRLRARLWKQGLVWENCVADTGYSSGGNYAFLEKTGLKSFIPPHGTYKGGPDGFTYNNTEDHYVCPQGKVIPFTKVFNDHRTGTKKKEYRARKHVCIDCPLRRTCLGKSAQEKKFSVTYYREEYERNIKRVNSKLGRYMKGKRQSTVEPVFGTLTQFMGMRKVNTIGLEQANKVMHLSAIAYNLKKYLKFTEKRSKSGAESFVLPRIAKNCFQALESSLVGYPKNIGWPVV
ncbi:IS1182 family transposase [Zobellia galactanivorans]|uniref:Transposase, family 11 n=1 Tax=Zobellia galactanivorans (strain DSM 12802 / CCUG 47099 / CIP 106680 / NCIMB 13871 / Dsij) TaxID=63186 RepID=G0L0Q2_ZOBGA|nr:IS1182 family transposase [Zobellia galactanivorans]CAZ97333.1 Transposase, family 11 [Zobellia galactanivorans]CAZ97560.1 Transposase, family 11 [Zobellia galactanivorans]